MSSGKWGVHTFNPREYDRTHRKNFSFWLRNDNEEDVKIMEYLLSIKDRSQYIINLIRQDMLKNKADSEMDK